jgi:hypothetical protein
LTRPFEILEDSQIKISQFSELGTFQRTGRLKRKKVKKKEEKKTKLLLGHAILVCILSL